MTDLDKIDLSDKKLIEKFLDKIGISTEKELLTVLRNRESQRKKLEKKESKEKREIEKNTFVVDGNLSLEEKITKGWKLIKDQETFTFKNNEKIQFKITTLENPLGDIWEFIDGVPEEYIGKQFFTPEAAERETKKSGKTIVKNQTEITSIMEEWQAQNEEKVKKTRKEQDEAGASYNPLHFFLKNNYPLAGYRKPDGTYSGIGIYTNIRFEGGKCLLFDTGDLRANMKPSDLHKCGFQVLCYTE